MFILGLAIGILLGVVLAAIMAVGKKADESICPCPFCKLQRGENLSLATLESIELDIQRFKDMHRERLFESIWETMNDQLKARKARSLLKPGQCGHTYANCECDGPVEFIG